MKQIRVCLFCVGAYYPNFTVVQQAGKSVVSSCKLVWKICRDEAFLNLHSLLYHPYLVCICFGMPSTHLFTFLMFFKSCIYIYMKIAPFDSLVWGSLRLATKNGRGLTSSMLLPCSITIIIYINILRSVKPDTKLIQYCGGSGCIHVCM